MAVRVCPCLASLTHVSKIPLNYKPATDASLPFNRDDVSARAAPGDERVETDPFS